jgi:hypothetical protein
MLDQSLHPRYRDPNDPDYPNGVWDLVGFAESVVANPNHHLGYYSRPEDEVPIQDANDLEWLRQWLDTAEIDWSANTFFHDTMGMRSCDDPNFIAHLYGDDPDAANGNPDAFSKHTVIEGPMDIYPAAYIVSGSLDRGTDYPGGPGHTIDDLGDPNDDVFSVPFAQLGTYVLNDRIMFNGYGNDQHLLWGSANNHWMERQCFLLGHKLEGRPWDTDPNEWNAAVEKVMDLRDDVGWWSRTLRYQDRRGITNVPDGIRVRRFTDEGNNRELLVVENWDLLEGRTFQFNGKNVNVPDDEGDELSILISLGDERPPTRMFPFIWRFREMQLRP